MFVLSTLRLTKFLIKEFYYYYYYKRIVYVRYTESG